MTKAVKLNTSLDFDMGVLLRDQKPTKFIVVPTDERFPEHRDESIYKVCTDYGLSPVG
jgi:hypothetical protein